MSLAFAEVGEKSFEPRRGCLFFSDLARLSNLLILFKLPYLLRYAFNELSIGLLLIVTF